MMRIPRPGLAFVGVLLMGCPTNMVPKTLDADGDGYDEDVDCDDGNPEINPDAEEVCNGADDNCDDEIDNDATDMVDWYVDLDGDGYGGDDTAPACELSEGYADNSDDCNDTDASINPGVEEVCDGVDNNCDGVNDYDAVDIMTYYLDSDGDGYGDPDTAVETCYKANGYIANGKDCDDTNPNISPGAKEACNDTDANCDGIIDNDADGDGYSDLACGGSDCDDNDKNNYNQCTPGLDPEYPGLSCNDIISQDSTVSDGTYWLDPNGGDPSDSFEVYCDMTTNGGGWTVTYFVDAEHFDAVYANNRSISYDPPTEINSQTDIWNAEQEMSFSEVMFACTTQDDSNTYWWSYTNTDPFTWLSDTTGNHNYQYINSSDWNGTQSTCISTHNDPGSYGFIVLEADSCGSCNTMLFGMYHYPSSRTGCNSTSTTYGSHGSTNDGRSIDYPICGGSQTSNGMFWIAVR